MENVNNDTMNRREVQGRLANELGVNFPIVLDDVDYCEEDYQKIKESIVAIAKKHLSKE